ncbi:MAG: energy-coupling factor transporter transmembrane component T [Dorea sp.]
MTNQEFIDSFRQDQKQENWWYRFHPITKMIFCLALGFMSLFVFKWQVGLVIFLIASVIAMTTPIYKKYFATIGIMFCGRLSVYSYCQIVCAFREIRGRAAFYLFGKAVPMAALISCLDLIFMIEGFLGIFLVFFMTTEMRDLCYCLEQKGMSPSATFMVLSTFSGIASIKDKLNNVRESQRARGIETEGSFIVKMKSILPVLFPVIISSMTGIEDKTLAMDARAFAANGKHTALRRITPAKFVEKLVAVLAVVICIVGTFVCKKYL